MPAQPGHRASHLHQPEPSDRSDRVEHHRLVAFRRRPERRPDRVPDQPGALPAHPLPAGHVRAGHLGREGLPRAVDRGRDHQRVLRAGKPDGQVRPPPGQVHGLLHAVPRRRRAQGRQRGHRHHQNQALHPVRRLVPHWIQGMFIMSIVF